MATNLSSINHLLKAISLIPLLLLLLDPVSVCEANILYSEERLNPNGFIRNEGYVLIMQRDCNLVLYDHIQPIWSSKTGGKSSNCFCSMQADGNFVVYTPDGNPIWASNTGRGRHGNYVLVLQNDRNLVIYGPALWATATNIHGTGVTIGNGMVIAGPNVTDIGLTNDTMAGPNDTNSKAEPLFPIVESE